MCHIEYGTIYVLAIPDAYLSHSILEFSRIPFHAHLKTVLPQHVLDEDQSAEFRDFLVGDGDRYAAVVGLPRQWFGRIVRQPRMLLQLDDRGPLLRWLLQHPADQRPQVRGNLRALRERERCIADEHLEGFSIGTPPGNIPDHQREQRYPH